MAVTFRTWTLAPGDTIVRALLHERFGGRVQGGMTTSLTSPNIFLFADPAAGERHGYFDGWAGDHFHYTGKGRRGDQSMVDINLALSRHADTGKAVRLFRSRAQLPLSESCRLSSSTSQ
jgi:hypothetical protein